MNSETIQILHEDPDFIVLNKPAGLSVHNESPSVSDFLQKCKKSLHFVNRLDRETSGLMLIAQKPELHAPLAEALTAGQKFYRALLRGPWKQAQNTPPDILLWSWPISDKSEGRKNPQGVSSSRVPASTQVQLIRTNAYFSEVRLELLTGRQHQIRKHSALAQHPIIGDPRYNDEKYNSRISELYQTKRMWLHAEELNLKWKSKDYHFKSKISLDRFFNNPN